MACMVVDHKSCSPNDYHEHSFLCNFRTSLHSQNDCHEHSFPIISIQTSTKPEKILKGPTQNPKPLLIASSIKAQNTIVHNVMGNPKKGTPI